MSEKRMIGEYEILASVNVGRHEIILCENPNAPADERYLCGYLETNDLFKSCTGTMVGKDYLDLAELFGQRVQEEAAKFKEELAKLDVPATVLSVEDCYSDRYDKDINGKLIVIDPKSLKPEYRRADRQLYLVTGGFGAYANARGNAVFCKNLHTGEAARFERYDVLGEAKPDRLPDWAKEKLAAHEKKKGKEHER
ncbi:MAG: hypothetical protein LUF00_13295 [Lachnospiraceae bacterium]|nr:hypothetical protein [Lachnospiraceae bacterium]